MPMTSRSHSKSPNRPADSIRPKRPVGRQEHFIISRDSLKAVAQALRVRFRTIVTLDGARSSRT